MKKSRSSTGSSKENSSSMTKPRARTSCRKTVSVPRPSPRRSPTRKSSGSTIQLPINEFQRLTVNITAAAAATAAVPHQPRLTAAPRLTHRLIPQPFDPEESLAWLQRLLLKVSAMAPKEEKEEFDDAASPELAKVTVELKEDEDSTVKINVDLYKKLFQTFNGFKNSDMPHQQGKQLVYKVFETILKLRVKRIHTCLFNTYFPQLLDVLSFGLSGLPDALAARRFVSIEGIEMSDALRSAVQRWNKVDAVLDVINPPCDVFTFAGVLDYRERCKAVVAEMIVKEKIIERACEHLEANFQALHPKEEGQQHDNASPPLSEINVEQTWRLVYEAIVLCTESLPTQHELVHVVQRSSKLLGRICHSVTRVDGSNQMAQLMASSVLRELTMPDKSEEVCAALMQLIRSFPVAWGYLIPALYCGHRAIQLECADALEHIIRASFESHRDPLIPALHDGFVNATGLMQQPVEQFVEGVRCVQDPTALVHVLSLLVTKDKDSPHRGENYAKFHQIIFSAVIDRLRDQRGVSSTSLVRIPLMQYLTHLLNESATSERDDDGIRDVAAECNAVAVVQEMHQQYAKVRSRGIPSIVCANLLKALKPSEQPETVAVVTKQEETSSSSVRATWSGWGLFTGFAFPVAPETQRKSR